ncbi:MAG: type II toxin-antitoxin system RelE/ParE family toxin [Planctomycetaceae bacterium]
MNNVDLSNRAEADVDEIWTYVARNNETAADRVIDRIYDRLEMLGEQPEPGESVGYLTAGLRPRREKVF